MYRQPGKAGMKDIDGRSNGWQGNVMGLAGNLDGSWSNRRARRNLLAGQSGGGWRQSHQAAMVSVF